MMKYQIGKFMIDLPDDHMLPNYQIEHPLYDRFLPFFLQIFDYNPNDTVCIVGSNIGDTLAALCDVRPEFTYLNFEADVEFFSILESNSSLITSIAGCNIINRNGFVGRDAKLNKLVGEGGTKHGVLVDDLDSQLIDLVILDHELPVTLIGNLRFLIVDVDGFDWDVINSGTLLIAEQLPAIFFEFFAQDLVNLNQYFSTIKMLERFGYSFTIFDNFGNIIHEIADFRIVQALANYVFSQNFQGTRTIYYLDILATTEKDLMFRTRAIKGYLKDIILK